MINKKIYWPLIFIFGMFALPMVAAAIFLYYGAPIKAHSSQHGILIKDERYLQVLNESRSNKWRILYVPPLECDEECIERKKMLHNLHIALGAQRDRVQILQATDVKICTEDINNIFIIDPKGLYVMRYPANNDLNGVLHDMRKLLKYSHVT